MPRRHSFFSFLTGGSHASTIDHSPSPAISSSWAMYEEDSGLRWAGCPGPGVGRGHLLPRIAAAAINSWCIVGSLGLRKRGCIALPWGAASALQHPCTLQQKPTWEQAVTEEQGKQQGDIQGGKAVTLGVKGSYRGHTGKGRGCHIPTGAGKSKAGSPCLPSTDLTQPGAARQAATQPPHRNPAAEDGRTTGLSQNRMGGEAGAPLYLTASQRQDLSPSMRGGACSEVLEEQQHQQLLHEWRHQAQPAPLLPTILLSASTRVFSDWEIQRLIN